MDIQPRTTVATPVDDKAWLLDDHGNDSALSGTFLPTDFGLAAGDVLKGGTPVIYNSGTKTYKSVVTDVSGTPTHTATATGHAGESVLIGDPSKRHGLAIQWHGAAISARIPMPDGVAFDAAKGSKHFLYR